MARAAGAIAEAENRCVAVAAEMDWTQFTTDINGWTVVIIYVVAIVITELARRKTRKKSLSLPYV